MVLQELVESHLKIFFKHLQGVEGGGGDCVDLGVHGELIVSNYTEILWCGSEFCWPPGGVLRQVVSAENHDFCIVGV